MTALAGLRAAPERPGWSGERRMQRFIPR